MYDQQPIETNIVDATLAPAQRTVSFNCTIYDIDADLFVQRDGVTCTYDATPVGLLEYSVTATPGVAGGSITFGADAVGGEKVVIDRKTPAYRMLQFPTSGPLPMPPLNDEQNFYAGALQAAAAWRERWPGFAKFRYGIDVGELQANTPETVIGLDANGKLRLYTATELAAWVILANLTAEDLAPFVGQILLPGNNITFVDNLDGTYTIDTEDCLLLEDQSGLGGGGGGGLTEENVRDIVAAFVTAGTNMTVTHNDAGDTLTFDAAGGGTGFTEEEVEDIVNGLLAAGTGITLSYNDAGNALTIAVSQTALKPPSAYQVEVVGYATVITTGIKKAVRAPFGLTLTGVRASLATAQTSGTVVTVDVLENGASIFTTDKLTFDNGEKTTTTAATQANLTDTSIADDAEITFQVTQVGDGTAKGLVVTLLYNRT